MIYGFRWFLHTALKSHPNYHLISETVLFVTGESIAVQWTITLTTLVNSIIAFSKRVLVDLYYFVALT